MNKEEMEKVIERLEQIAEEIGKLREQVRMVTDGFLKLMGNIQYHYHYYYSPPADVKTSEPEWKFYTPDEPTTAKITPEWKFYRNPDEPSTTVKITPDIYNRR